MSPDRHLVTVTEDGLVVEMWRGARKVTLDIRLDAAEFTKVWGPDVNDEMATGTVGVDTSAEALFAWLGQGNAPPPGDA